MHYRSLLQYSQIEQLKLPKLNQLPTITLRYISVSLAPLQKWSGTPHKYLGKRKKYQTSTQINVEIPDDTKLALTLWVWLIFSFEEFIASLTLLAFLIFITWRWFYPETHNTHLLYLSTFQWNNFMKEVQNIFLSFHFWTLPQITVAVTITRFY